MRFSDILAEGRDAPLYHACGWANAVSIVRSDAIDARTTHDAAKLGLPHDVAGVSLTRDRSMAGQWGKIVFELDQRLLAMHHPIRPFDYWGKSPEAAMTDQRRRSRYAEAEEFVLGPIRHLGSLLRAIRIHRVEVERMNRDFPGYCDERDGLVLLRHPKLVLV